MQDAAAPIYTLGEAAQHATFTALMTALSYPGRAFDLPEGDPFALIADTLLDLETSYCTPDDALVPVLVQTGARELPPSQAAYHFYPTGLDLDAVEAAHVGDMLYPDTAATLVIRCAFEGAIYEWNGPGIASAIPVKLNLPAEFWALRERATYPLGCDVFLTDGRRVIGLPRTTRVRTLTAEVR